jgi:transcriptional regulator with XRE-family HTH domain
MLSDITELLHDFNPNALQVKIGQHAKEFRLAENITQSQLASRSGVSLGSLKRFERTGEISLHNLLRLAILLNATDAFKQLFVRNEFRTVDDILKLKKSILRKRASKKP